MPYQSEVQPRAVLADGTPMNGLVEIVRARARVSPEAIAVEESGTLITFHELDVRASQVANGLLVNGVGERDRVAYVGRNSSAQLELLHGAPRAGAIPALLNHRLSSAELRGVLEDLDPAALIVDETAPLLDDPRAWLPSLKLYLNVEHSQGGSFAPWRDVQNQTDPGALPVRYATQLIFYTSGTTGRPKGVELSGGNLAYPLGGMQATIGIDTDSVCLAPIPFFHVAGLGLALLAGLDGGRLLLRDIASPGELLETLVDHHVTHAVAVPTVIQHLLTVPAVLAADWSALRFIVYGASPIPLPVLVQATEVFKCEFMQGYGLTESTGGNCVLTPEDHRKAIDTGRHELLRSVGKPLPGTVLRIVDPATGEDVEPGGRGEVWMSGPSLMNGYWRKPEVTAQTIVECGWLRTGDGGSLDAEGYLWLHDRIKDMIVSGGENIYPAEVESVLTAHPDVVEVAVIGVPSERWGESPFAYVVPVAGTGRTEEEGQEILSWSRERLAHYKVPVGLRFVDAIPRNASGKILKASLRLDWADATG